MPYKHAARLDRLPPYIFAQIEQLKAQKRKEGVDLIPLGIGDPDIPCPDFIVDKLCEEVRKPENHQYPTSMGEEDFRQTVAEWCKIRFGLDLDPNKNVMNVLGGNDGVSNIGRTLVDPGEIVLFPSHEYPVYANAATQFSEGVPYIMPLKEENDFLPDLEAIPTKTLKQASVMFLNYRNNPTGAIATPEFYQHASDLAEDYNLLIVSDNPYSEFTYGNYIAPSFLQTNPNHIEINSCSKIFNMTGFRCGWAYGGDDAIAALKSAKSQVDSGCPMFIQRAVITALQTYTSAEKPAEVAQTMQLYESRMRFLVEGLNAIGWPVKLPKATFYLWAKCPNGEEDDMAFAMKLIEVGVVVTPGVGFGEEGKGFVRFALTQPEERIKEALERIANVMQ